MTDQTFPERIFVWEEPGRIYAAEKKQRNFEVEYIRADVHRELQARVDKLSGRLCVTCGKQFPSSQSRTEPGEGCSMPDMCSIDMTTEEAFGYMCQRAHDYRVERDKLQSEVNKMQSALEKARDIAVSMEKNVRNMLHKKEETE